MEDSDTEGNETEALVNPSSVKEKKGFATSSGLFPTSSSPHLKPDVSPRFGPIPPSHPPALPSRPPKDTPRDGPGPFSSPRKSFQDVNSPLHTLHESTEEPTLEEVHLPERKETSYRDGYPYIGQGSSSSYILCPFFGVRNYLHNFYEKPKAPQDMMAGREEVCLVKRRHRRHPQSVFRLSLLLGSIILLLGAIAFIVAACTSRRTTLIGKIGGVPVEDRIAAAHNAEVDALLLVGLTAVTLGATVLAGALVSQAFCYPSDYEETITNNLWTGQTTSIYEYPQWFHTMEKRVPATEQVTQVQPSLYVHRFK